MTDTASQFWQVLEQSPEPDWLTLAVLSEYLEETARTEEDAEFVEMLRWCVAEERWPQRHTFINGDRFSWWMSATIQHDWIKLNGTANERDNIYWEGVGNRTDRKTLRAAFEQLFEHWLRLADHQRGELRRAGSERSMV